MNPKRCWLFGGLAVLLLVVICSYVFWPRDEAQPIQQPEPEIVDGDPEVEDEPWEEL